jgi:quinol-cytochrome oxidoreductase complex cytochrome b subunit
MNSGKDIQATASSLRQRILHSIFPEPVFPSTDRQRRRFLLKNLVLHFRPATVPEKTLRLSLTWGLGGMAAILVLLQLGTGVLLKFVYEPTPVGAYASVQSIVLDVPFGKLIRNTHHWAAHLLVLVAFFHLLRVFFTGAFQQPPRQFNWIVGLFLFFLVLMANLTGYLLPWDQVAFWAVTVATGMLEYIPLIGHTMQKTILGGTEIGPATLRNFYAVHTAIVPIFLSGLMAFHFWRIRKSGGLVIPRTAGEAPDPNPIRVPSVPNLLLREITAALVLVAALLIAAVFVDAPLAGPANSGMSPNPTRAPWYFAGIQELLLHLHPVFAVCVIPILIAIGLLAVPYLSYETDTSGIWFASRAGRKTATMAAIACMCTMPLLILTDEWIAGGQRASMWLSPMIGNGLIPLAVLAAVLAFFLWMLRRRYTATKKEAVQVVFVLLVVAYGVLTLTNILFRGKGMALRVPW